MKQEFIETESLISVDPTLLSIQEEGQDIISLLKNKAVKKSEKTVFLGSEKALNYSSRDLLTKIYAYSEKLKKMGVQEGDSLFLLLTPSMDLYALIFAAWTIKVNIILIENFLTVSKIKKIIEDLSPKVLIYIKKFRNIVNILEEMKLSFKRCEISAFLTEDEFLLDDFSLLNNFLEPDFNRECLTIIERDKKRHLNQHDLIKLTELYQTFFKLNENSILITEYPLVILISLILGVPAQYVKEDDFLDSENFSKNKENVFFLSKKTIIKIIKRKNQEKNDILGKIFINGVIYSNLTLETIRKFWGEELFFTFSLDKGVPLSLRHSADVHDHLRNDLYLDRGIPVGKIHDFWQAELIQKGSHYYLMTKSLGRFENEERREFRENSNFYFNRMNEKYFFLGNSGDEVFENENLFYPYQVIPKLEKLNEIDHAAIVQYQEMKLGKTFAVIIKRSLRGRKRHWSKIIRELENVFDSFDLTPDQIIDSPEIPYANEDPFDYDFKRIKENFLKTISFHTQVKDDLFVILKGIIFRHQIIGVFFVFSLLFNLMVINFSTKLMTSSVMNYMRTTFFNIGFWFSVYNFIIFFLFSYFLIKQAKANVSSGADTDIFIKDIFSHTFSIKRTKKLTNKGKGTFGILLSQLLLNGLIIGSDSFFVTLIQIPFLILGVNLYYYFENKSQSAYSYLLKIYIFSLTAVAPLFGLVGKEHFFYDYNLLSLSLGTFSLLLLSMSMLEDQKIKSIKPINGNLNKMRSYVMCTFFCSSLLLLVNLKIIEMYHLGNNSFYIPVISYLGIISGLAGVVGDNSKKRIAFLKVIVSCSVILSTVNLLAFSLFQR